MCTTAMTGPGSGGRGKGCGQADTLTTALWFRFCNGAPDTKSRELGSCVSMHELLLSSCSIMLPRPGVVWQLPLTALLFALAPAGHARGGRQAWAVQQRAHPPPHAGEPQPAGHVQGRVQDGRVLKRRVGKARIVNSRDVMRMSSSATHQGIHSTDMACVLLWWLGTFG